MSTKRTCDQCGKDVPAGFWSIQFHGTAISSRDDLCSWECLHDFVAKFERNGKRKRTS